MHINVANKADRSPCFLFKKYIFSCFVLFLKIFNKVMELATAVDNKNKLAVLRVCVTYNLYRAFQKKCVYTLTADGST